MVPVKAVLDNSSSLLKPGIFAEVEVLTNRIPTPILAIKSSAVVDANGKKLVYLQNGNAYQPVEVNLGQMFGDMVEIKSGLFEGDLIVTQRAPQLYAQSLRSGVKAQESRGAGGTEESEGENDLATGSLPWWLVVPVGGRSLRVPSGQDAVASHQPEDLPMKPATVLYLLIAQMICQNLTTGHLVNRLFWLIAIAIIHRRSSETKCCRN